MDLRIMGYNMSCRLVSFYVISDEAIMAQQNSKKCSSCIKQNTSNP